MKLSPCSLSLCVILFVWPNALTAQRPGGGHYPLHPVEQAIDINGDGTLSASEIKNAGQALLHLDTNGDGRVTADESEPARRGPGRGFGAPRGGDELRPPPHPIAEALDLNHNNVFDESELAVAAKALQRLDTDGNGEITQMEIHPQGHPTGPEGGNRRPEFGGLSESGPSEPFHEFARNAPSNPQPASNHEAVRRVMALDLDDDQRVSRAELPSKLVGLMRADTNRDGFITRTEARDFVEQLRPSESGKRRQPGF